MIITLSPGQVIHISGMERKCKFFLLYNSLVCGDESRSPFQLEPDFLTRQPAGSAEEQLFSAPLGSIKEQWRRQAREKAWRASLLVDDRY